MCKNLTVKYHNRKFRVPNNIIVAKYSKAKMRHELFSKTVLRVVVLCSVQKKNLRTSAA